MLTSSQKIASIYHLKTKPRPNRGGQKGELVNPYHKARQKALFDELVAAAGNPRSHLFVVWINNDGTQEFYARSGCAPREEFWRGMDGIRSLAEPGSNGKTAYKAGQHVRRMGIEPACSAGRLDPATGRVRIKPGKA